jgi:hypothetical protein
MLEGVSGVFKAGRGEAETEDFECGRRDLHSKIGQLATEVDFLRKRGRACSPPRTAPAKTSASLKQGADEWMS